jgi:hypothetical protein
MVLANCQSKSGVWDGLRDVSETGCMCECGEIQALNKRRFLQPSDILLTTFPRRQDGLAGGPK